MKRAYPAMVLVFVMILAGLAGAGHAQTKLEILLEDNGYEMDDLIEVSTYYYRGADKQKLLDISMVLFGSEEFVASPEGFVPFSHFLAVVASGDEEVLAKLEELEASSEGVRKDALRSVIDQAADITSPDPSSPRDIDMLWSEFVATGSASPVEKVIGVIRDKAGSIDVDARAMDSGTFNEAMLYNSAKWSLKANAFRHDKVYDILKKETEAADKGPFKDDLLVVLEEVTSLRESQ